MLFFHNPSEELFHIPTETAIISLFTKKKLFMKKFLLSLTLLSGFVAAKAQFPTTTTPAANCSVFRNFNLFNENFSTPSIYSDDNDVSLFYNFAEGALVENSGLSGPRSGSVISPTYLNSLDNEVTVGFYYEAPLGTQYRIRVVSALNNPTLEILATTANGPMYTTLPSAPGATFSSGFICVRLQDLDLEPNAQIRFEVTYRYFGFTGTRPFLFDDVSLTVVGGPLPVDFLGFIAREQNDGSTKLLWDVAHEVNVKGYNVETSVDGRSFTSIGFVPATGSNVYSFPYAQKIAGTRFFRVKSIDLDNSFKSSGIIKIKGQSESVSSIQLYPVPAISQVYVQHDKVSNNAMISVLSPDGKIIKQVRPVSNSFQTQLNVSELKAGVYFVRYDNGEGKVETIKMVKN